MGLLPEKEPVKNKYENPTDISPLNIERKEVVTPVPSQFKAKIVSQKGEPLINTTDDTKFTIKIPQVNQKQMEDDIKAGDKEEAKIWSIGFWLRMFKKAIFFGWKVVFDR